MGRVCTKPRKFEGRNEHGTVDRMCSEEEEEDEEDEEKKELEDAATGAGDERSAATSEGAGAGLTELESGGTEETRTAEAAWAAAAAASEGGTAATSALLSCWTRAARHYTTRAETKRQHDNEAEACDAGNVNYESRNGNTNHAESGVPRSRSAVLRSPRNRHNGLFMLGDSHIHSCLLHRIYHRQFDFDVCHWPIENEGEQTTNEKTNENNFDETKVDGDEKPRMRERTKSFSNGPTPP